MIRYRKATLADIPEMQAMVAEQVKEGVILPRSDDEVATNIRSYILAEAEGMIVGYGALHIHSPRLAEIRSLIVSPTWRCRGVGAGIVREALREAEELGVEEVLVLTYVSDFFRQLGFHEIAKESIPEQKIWTDCIKCIHFPNCNESSLVYTVNPRRG
ncbi:N-acetyltransferase [Nitratifractor salsuginis]|uniref:N-acetylglutamate synthase n=1 Tax=Nitratifractor salsuginis (strain DSM 16511 / JCM 12458 / E9I37-1) TaxID=749222 RepID=E6X360_NITSE|nr:N-acetyltransferase [Nitratifractor salsuginis]ADV46204.1 N-acetylglutamate synthase [Nitratifractor salsuginis DSM 16511]